MPHNEQDQPRKSSFLKVRVEEDVLEQLNELARQNERTTAGEARLALKEHLRTAKVHAG